MLKRINKKYIYIIVVLFLTISFIVGFSLINSSYTLASGNITFQTTSCSNQKLYDRIACMSSLDTMPSKYVDKAIIFNESTQSKEEIEYSNDKNGLGVYELTRTMGDEFPVYYYRGDVDNNNVKFAGFCWKIVRTTSTGGTKIIYNGEPKANGQCSDDTADSHIIGTTSYDSSNIYNTDYVRDIPSRETVELEYTVGEMLRYTAITTQLLFSNSYTYDQNNSVYVLDNPQTYTWSESYNNLTGYYTCSFTSANLSTDSSCSTLNYITGTNSSQAISITLENGENAQAADKELAFGNDYTDNGNGTYTLIQPSHIKKSTWNSQYQEDYNYVCPDNNETCSNIQAIYKKDNMNYYYFDSTNPITFGKSVSYNGTEYTLNDTVDIWDFSWKSNHQDAIYNLLDYNYTFYGLSNHTVAYYITMRTYRPTDNPVPKMEFKALKLSNGKLSLTRTINSYIKTMVDNWYNTNLTSVSSKIEDTPYCNDTRTVKTKINDYYLESAASERISRGNVDISCNEYDSYTVDSTKGNGLLTYPIGLLTYDELIMGGCKGGSSYSYLDMQGSYYLMTPNNINQYMICINNNNSYICQNDSAKGVRPVISLKNNVQITSGSGTLSDPYIVS